MSSFYGNAYKNVSDIKGPTGFYTLMVDGKTLQVFVDQDYSGGGWVCVLANRAYTGGMNNLTYTNAINGCNYRTGGSNNGSNTLITTPTKLSGLSNYNIFIGLRYWKFLSGRQTSGKMTMVQFVSGSNGTALSATSSHNKRYRWTSNYFNGTYGFNGVAGVSDETGTGSPGMYSYHASNSFSMSTYDLDQDQNGGNCSTYYNNNPWWYGSCWSGNYFAGGGYQDAPYWDGSGSDYYQYGAVYIK